MRSHHTFRILVIDDNPDTHKDFVKILTSENKAYPPSTQTNIASLDVSVKTVLPSFEIDVAEQGKEGLVKIIDGVQNGYPYAMAFLDVQKSSEWDGVETIQHIWKIDKDMQIAVCAANFDGAWNKIVSRLGHNENLLILRKPFDHVAVRQLATALSRKWELLKFSQEYAENIEKIVAERTKSLVFQATHDALTQVANRKFLSEHLSELVDRASHSMSRFAVLFIDVNDFKMINDTYGHAFGDQLLIEITERLKRKLRSNDFLARLGGDEFVFVVNRFDSHDALRLIADKIHENFKDPFAIQGREISVKISIGLSVFPDHGKSVDELLRKADIAMYTAKNLGENKAQFYSDQLPTQDFKLVELVNDMRRAVKNNEFFLVYQPQYESSNKVLLSVEALIRWNHPARGIVYPIDFISIAEEIGLFDELGEWVIRTACQQNKAWQDGGLRPIKVSVNITAQQFKRVDLPELIGSILNETQLQSQYLELELAEHIIMNSVSVIDQIKKLKELGVSIAVDDFGVGNSGLNYLCKIPLDKLKIDQSFVRDLAQNPNDQVIIQAIMTMARNLNLKVVAEGVETKPQLDFLTQLYCNEVQGYYFSKPMSSVEIEKILEESIPS